MLLLSHISQKYSMVSLCLRQYSPHVYIFKKGLKWCLCLLYHIYLRTVLCFLTVFTSVLAVSITVKTRSQNIHRATFKRQRLVLMSLLSHKWLSYTKSLLSVFASVLTVSIHHFQKKRTADPWSTVQKTNTFRRCVPSARFASHFLSICWDILCRQKGCSNTEVAAVCVFVCLFIWSNSKDSTKFRHV